MNNYSNRHMGSDEAYELTSASRSKILIPPRSRWCIPRCWDRKCLGWTAAASLIVAIIIAVVIVEILSAARYPDYSELEYSLVDVYQGETFFDKFDCFSG